MSEGGKITARRKPRAPPIPPATWDLHKHEIKRFYVDQGSSFEQLKSLLAGKGVSCSDQQLWAKLREWGFKKTERKRKRVEESSIEERDARVDEQAPISTQALHHNGTAGHAPLANVNNQSGNSGPVAQGSQLALFSNNPMPTASNLVGHVNSTTVAPNPILWPTQDQTAYQPSFNGPLTMDWAFNGLPPLSTPGASNYGGVAAATHQNITPSSPKRSKSVQESKRRTIHAAAEAGNLELVEWLVQHDPTCLAAEDSDGRTPMSLAASEGHVELVAKLCLLGVDVNKASSENLWTPIHLAAEEGHLKVVSVLLEHNANPDLMDSRQVTPLWYAAQNGHYEIVELLLQKQVRVDPPANNGRTPLHQAAEDGHLEIVEILLEHNANPDPIDSSKGVTPLWSASYYGHHEVVALLIKHGANTETAASKEDFKRPLHVAVQCDYLNVVQALLDGNALVSPETDGAHPEVSSPLVVAASLNHLEILEELLKRGAKVDPGVGDERGCPTALWMAACRNHVEVIEVLLNHGADANYASEKYGAPLHAAASNGNTAAALLLLGRGANVDTPAIIGFTPLHLAAGEGYQGVLRILLEHGADVNAQDNDGRTALWDAARKGRTEVVPTLIKAHAKSLPIDSDGSHPIHEAAEGGHFEIIKLLVEHDPTQVFLKNNDGETALVVAADGIEPIRLEIVKYLHAHGAEII